MYTGMPHDRVEVVVSLSSVDMSQHGQSLLISTVSTQNTQRDALNFLVPFGTRYPSKREDIRGYGVSAFGPLR